MDCIDLAKDRDRWNAVVKAAMDRPVRYNASKFLTEELLASQEFLRCMELFKVQNTKPDALLVTRSTALCSAGNAGL